MGVVIYIDIFKYIDIYKEKIFMDPQKVFRALSDLTRLRMVAVLSHGTFNVQELTSLIGATQSTISHHLKILQRAGIIVGRKSGVFVFYSLSQQEEAPFAASAVGLFSGSLDSASLSADLRNQFEGDLAEAKEIQERRKARTRDYFEAHASEWEELREQIPAIDKCMPMIKESIADKAALLDLGCGTGVLLKELLPRSGKTIGIDSSAAMVREAKRGLQSKSSSVEFHVCEIEDLPLGDQSIDCAVSHMVFHHLADPADALIEIARVLKSGAKLLLSELAPHENPDLQRELANLWAGFDPEEFQRWVKQAGFENIDFKYFGEHREVFLLTATKK